VLVGGVGRCRGWLTLTLGGVVLDRPQERVRKGTVDTYLISAPRRSTSARQARVGRSHAEIGRWDVLVDIPQPVDEHPDFDPRNDYSLKVSTAELSDVERNVAAGLTPDDIDLDLTT
jgi:hypothetical protein